MGDTTAGLLQAGLLVIALAAVHRPLGDRMAEVFSSAKHWRVERLTYRAMGVDGNAEQTWPSYARAVLAFSLLSVLGLYGLERLQHHLWLSLGMKAVEPRLAWNTAASFVTNTNWQNYSGEQTMGHLVQMAGLAVQNFVSAAVGLAVAVALVRGFARNRSDRIGSFWVDLTRSTFRILLPLSTVAAIVLLAAGVVQNLHGPHLVTTVTGAHQSIPGGPIASQEAIKELGTNGGGFLNANSAHPFENPNPFTDWFEIFLLLAIPFSLPRTFGKLVGDVKQGYAILAVMALFWVASLGAVWGLEAHHHDAVTNVMEGKETRFGLPASALFATSTTLTSTGAVNAAHDSFSSLGGGVLIGNMMTGEIVPGGVGSGLYGVLVLAVISVFLAGLMVGRTPEYLGKKIQAREIKMASLYVLATPICVLVATAFAIALPGERASMLNHGAHGLSEVLYAFTSMGNNNGSAFGGLTGNTAWYNVAGGIVMLLARFLPMIFALGLAGSLARQQHVPVTEGTLGTTSPLFVVLLSGVVVIVVGLTYFPALALGPLAEGLGR